MRLDLRSILHVPGASLPFSFALALSGLDFYGEHPFAGPVQVSGTVRNQADALVLEGTAETTLELVCDRCLKPFCRDMRVPVDSLLAETLEDEENDELEEELEEDEKGGMDVDMMDDVEEEEEEEQANGDADADDEEAEAKHDDDYDV